MTTLTKSQTIKKTTRFTEDGNSYVLTATIRHDDNCGNGHNSFSITGDLYRDNKNGYKTMEACGCLHDDIARHFPELEPYLKWHLTSTDGPMHYVANTIYHAQDTDYRGLHKGEKGQLVNGRSKLPVWESVVKDSDGEYHKASKYNWRDSKERPENDGNIEWQPVWITGEGKERDIDAARNCAVWPDATLEQLLDESALKERLPALMADFQSDVESLGLTY